MKKLITEKEVSTVVAARDILDRLSRYAEDLTNRLWEYEKDQKDPEGWKRTVDEAFAADEVRKETKGALDVRISYPAYWDFEKKENVYAIIDKMVAFRKDLDAALESSPGVLTRSDGGSNSYFLTNRIDDWYCGMRSGELFVVRFCKKEDCEKVKRLLKSAGFSYKRHVKHDQAGMAAYEIGRAK